MRYSENYDLAETLKEANTSIVLKVFFVFSLPKEGRYVLKRQNKTLLQVWAEKGPNIGNMCRKKHVAVQSKIHPILCKILVEIKQSFSWAAL